MKKEKQALAIVEREERASLHRAAQDWKDKSRPSNKKYERKRQQKVEERAQQSRTQKTLNALEKNNPGGQEKIDVRNAKQGKKHCRGQ